MSNTNAKPKLLPDPEVEARPHRRTFTGECPAKILVECDAAAAEPDAMDAILRRAGLYSSRRDASAVTARTTESARQGLND